MFDAPPPSGMPGMTCGDQVCSASAGCPPHRWPARVLVQYRSRFPAGQFDQRGALCRVDSKLTSLHSLEQVQNQFVRGAVVRCIVKSSA